MQRFLGYHKFKKIMRIFWLYKLD